MCLILPVYLLVINVLEILVTTSYSFKSVQAEFETNISMSFDDTLLTWWENTCFFSEKGAADIHIYIIHMQTSLSIIGREMHEEQLFPLKLCKAWLLKHILRSPNYILPRVICVMCMIYIGSSRSGALTIYWDVFCTHGMCRSSLCSENTKHCDVGDLCRSLKYNAMQCNRKF